MSSSYSLKAIVPLLLLAGLYAGCEKEVNIDIVNGKPQIVVNGFIETGQPPVLLLSRSFGYLSTFDQSTIANNFVHDARITVSNGSREVSLREYEIDTGSDFRFYIYSIDSADQQARTFLGRVNETYTLTVIADGKTYTSTTRIPDCRPPDSLAALLPDEPDLKKPTARVLNLYYSDPDTPGNCYRYFTSLNGSPFHTASTSVFDDALVGNTGSTARLPLFLGYDRSTASNDSTGYLFPGDRVTLKWCAIERPVFNFYTTFEYTISNVGNPFTTPINVRSNITGGGLGVWAGYGATQMTLVVPR